MTTSETSAPVTVNFVPGDSKSLDHIEGGTVRDYAPDLVNTQAVTLDGKPIDDLDTPVLPGANLIVASKAGNG